MFWNAYPWKSAKKKALKAWTRLMPDGGLTGKIMAALEVQKSSRLWQQGIGIPLASTWLNEERWDDEVRADGRTGGAKTAETSAATLPRVEGWFQRRDGRWQKPGDSRIYEQSELPAGVIKARGSEAPPGPQVMQEVAKLAGALVMPLGGADRRRPV